MTELGESGDPRHREPLKSVNPATALPLAKLPDTWCQLCTGEGGGRKPAFSGNFIEDDTVQRWPQDAGNCPKSVVFRPQQGQQASYTPVFSPLADCGSGDILAK
eukprot:gene18663-biopygen23436